MSKPRVRQPGTQFNSDRWEEVEEEELTNFHEENNPALGSASAWMEDVEESLGGGPYPANNKNLFFPCHVSQYAVAGVYQDEMGTEAFEGSRNLHHGEVSTPAVKKPAARPQSQNQRSNGGAVNRGGRPSAQNSKAPMKNQIPQGVQKPGALFKQYAKQQSNENGGAARVDPRNLPGFGGAPKAPQTPSPIAPPKPVSSVGSYVNAPAAAGKSAKPTPGGDNFLSVAQNAEDSPFIYVSAAHEEAITQFHLDLDFGSFSLRDLAAGTGMKAPNVAITAVSPNVIDQQIGATYNPVTKLYEKCDKTKAVVTKIVVTQQKNEFPIDFSLDCDAIREDAGNVQKNSYGYRAPHVIYGGTTSDREKEIYSGVKAIGNAELLAKYGQHDPYSLTKDLRKMPATGQLEESYYVPADHLLVNLIKQNSENKEFKDLLPCLSQERIFLPTKRADKVISDLNEDILKNFKFTDLSNLVFTLQPSNLMGHPADELSHTKYAQMDEEEKEKLLNTKFQARFSVRVDAYSPRMVKRGDMPSRFCEIPLNQRASE